MSVMGYAGVVATCKCGTELGPRNRSGMCRKCYEKTPERMAVSRDKAKAWREADPERAKSSYKKWRENNPTDDSERSRKWRENNPDKVRADRDAHEARKRDLFVEEVRRFVVLARDRGRYHLCLKQVDPQKWHLDHVISTAQGGPHCYANVAVSHPACNMRKSDDSWSSDPVRWAEAIAAFEAFHGRQYK